VTCTDEESCKPSVSKWLEAHPRFHMHFTPTYLSWINQVERFFAFSTADLLVRSDHRSVQALEKDIRAWVKAWNDNPRPPSPCCIMQTKRYDWARLNHLQVGRYAEYLAKMEFAMFGFDNWARSWAHLAPAEGLDTRPVRRVRQFLAPASLCEPSWPRERQRSRVEQARVLPRRPLKAFLRGRAFPGGAGGGLGRAGALLAV